MPIFGEKRKVIFVRNINGMLVSTGKSKFVSPDVTSIKFKIGNKTKTHALNISKPNLYSAKRWVYFVDVERGQIPDFYQANSPVSAEYIDTMVSKSTVRNLVSRVEKSKISDYLVYIILTLCAGIPVGYILGLVLPIG